MIKTVRDAWQIPELRRKILFTIFALLIFRLGAAIPVPYINTSGLETYLSAQSGTILGLMNAMSGSAFSMATLFALSIQPYINSSIIIQLLTVAIPALERMSREGGEEGKRKIKAITRYATVAIAVLQALGYYFLMRNNGILTDSGIWAALVIMVSFVAGSSFLMWLGEQITEFGIGNGISILLFAGIVSRFPQMVSDMITGIRYYLNPLTEEQMESMSATDIAVYENLMLAPWMIAVIVIGMLALVVFIVFISNAERRLPVQYAKRVVGRKMYGGQSSHIPLKVNMSGVMPIIFAGTIMSIPSTIGGFISASWNPGLRNMLLGFNMHTWLYCILYIVLIFAFNYFYVDVQFDGVQMAENLRRNGGTIPGIRPGAPTSEYLDKTAKSVVFLGAMVLAVIAAVPIVLGNLTGLSIQLGGTSLLIVCGVALETVTAMDSFVMARHHKGFLN